MSKIANFAPFYNLGNLGNLSKAAFRLCVKNTSFFPCHLCVKNVFYVANLKKKKSKIFFRPSREIFSRASRGHKPRW